MFNINLINIYIFSSSTYQIVCIMYHFEIDLIPDDLNIKGIIHQPSALSLPSFRTSFSKITMTLPFDLMHSNSIKANFTWPIPMYFVWGHYNPVFCCY